MTDPALDAFHARQAKLQSAAPHWQEKLAYGDEHIGWAGDRALALYFDKFTDEMVIQYELPDKKPVLVFKVPVEGFDIDRVCAMLRDADHRRRTVREIEDSVDSHNAKILAAEDQHKADSLEAAHEKLRWAVRKDTGNHIAPLQVSRNPTRPGVLSSPT